VNKIQKILVAGATGYVGGHLVPRLIEEGYSVTCMARDPEKVFSRGWENIEVVRADAFDPASLEKAMRGIDVAYYLIHSMGGHKNFKEKDNRAARNFAEAASKNTLQRIIYLGGLGRGEDNLSVHLQSRQEVGEILASTGVPVTELRASIIIGAGSASFEIIRDLVRRLRIMITPKWVNSRCEPIAIANVIDYLIGCLKVEKTVGQILEIGCGQVYTYGEMMRQVGEIMGKRVIMMKVPVLTPRLSAYWLNLVTTVPMNVAYPLVDGLRNDTVCDDTRIRKWIPVEPLSFQEAVKTAIVSEDPTARWTEANLGSNEYPLPDLDDNMLSNIQRIVSGASKESLFGAIQRIGGDHGWYSVGWAWKIRGILDRIIGGVGMRRGRRDPDNLRTGDALDFWRVLEVSDNEKLTLLAEMKLPGFAWLQFEIQSMNGNQNVFIQRALFKPSGWFGYMYWYMLMPIHPFIFKTMARNIVRYAEAGTVQ